MADNDIKIDVIVNTDNATRQFEKLDDELKDVKKSADNASGGFSSLEKKLITAGSALNLASAAAGLVVDGLKAIPEAIQKGADIDDVSEAFNKLTKSAGTTAQTLLKELNAATLDTVRNFDLMRRGSISLQAGIKPDALITFAKAAKSLSDGSGADLLQVFDDLTRAYTTGRVGLELAKLGVIGYEKAEDKLGSTLIARNTLLQAATSNTNQHGSAVKDTGDLIKGLNKTFEDTKDALYQSIANNQQLNTSLLELATTIQTTDFEPLINGLSSIVTISAKAASNLLSVIKYIREAGASKDQFGGLGKISVDLFEKVTGLKTSNAAATAPSASSDVNASPIGTIANNKIALATVATKAQSEATEQLAKDYDTLKRVVDRLTGFDSYPKLVDQIKEAITNKSSQTAKEYANTLEGLGRRYRELGGDVTDFQSAFSDAEKKIEEAKKKLEESAKEKGFGSSLFESIFGIDLNNSNQQLQAQFANSMASAITGGLQLALSGLQGGKITSGQIGASLGSIAGGIAGNAIGGPVGGIIGSQIGATLGELVGGLFASKDGPGTAARKAADKFFADAFDANRLSVIVKGQLVKINDLVFRGDTLFNGNSDFGDGSFSNYFNSLTDGVKQAFEGVGRAFEEIIGNSEDFAGQLGAIFANNIGGDLNNLQLLVQATGKSFEELGQAIEKAFQKGNLSAVQAQQSFAQLNQLAKPGVPGQKGAANTAFRNLLNAGAKGGNATLDALKDIGAEGLELGITSISQLREVFQQYVRSGQFSQKEVNVLFKALDNLNIKTTQQLSSANNNTLIALAAQLESTGVLKVIDGIVEQITKLPSEKTIKIKVDTQFTGDRSAAKVAGIYADGTRSSSVSAR